VQGKAPLNKKGGVGVKTSIGLLGHCKSKCKKKTKG